MAFGPEGLTLGAGTVLAPLEDLSSADLPDGRTEARLCALLSAAYRRPIGSQAVRYIRRGAMSWCDGDKAMAAMHLAMTGLTPLRDVKGAARRLFMADALMTAGTGPETILRALDLTVTAGADVLTRYDNQEYRNPKGSGRVSGRWAPQGATADAASGVSTSAETTLIETGPASLNPLGDSQLRQLIARQVVQLAQATAIQESIALLKNPATLAALASLAVRFSAPTAFFSVLLTPTNRTSPDKIPVPGHPDMHLERDVGSLLWRFIYKDKAGVQHTVLQQDDSWIRAADGQVVGRMDRRRNAVIYIRTPIDALADEGGKGGRPAKLGVSVEDERPNLCPKPVKDYHGGGPLSQGRLYEDLAKSRFNPDLPTPSGMGYSLPNPEARTGRVMFDDCQRKTGMMAEAKGPTFSKFVESKIRQAIKNNNNDMLNKISKKLIRQGYLQVGAAKLAGDRPIVWFCYKKHTAAFIKDLFRKYGHGLEKIRFSVLP
jgi:hypothetical protein